MHGEDVGVVQRTGGARLAFKTREMLLVVGESGGKKLDGDFAGEPRIAGAVDLAHAAGADGLDDLVRSKPAPGLQPDSGLLRRHRRLLEKPRRFPVVVEQRLHLGLQFRIAAARTFEKCGLPGRVEFQSSLQNRLDPPVAFRTHAALVELSSRCSQALAIRQSRLTVAGDTPNTCAVSSMFRPPK